MRDRDDGFNGFVGTSGARLLRAAELLTGDRHRAEDLLQDVLARVYTRWDRIHGDPEPYVRRALLNAQRSWWRSRARREAPAADLPDAGDPSTSRPGTRTTTRSCGRWRA